ncbi:MAG: ferrous iron transport protein B [Bacteroidetes bacterium]|nr:ferrous iron transport protein B [Bacteroidota bacterium]
MTLFDLKQGDKAVITKVKGRGAFRKRIMEMGFIVGKEIIVGKKAPLKNPIEYTIMGYNVSLRNSEAQLIEVITDVIDHSGTKSYNGVFGDNTLKHSNNSRGKEINVALVGNPNCGKTTIFNFASHSHEKVGNYGGVTVDAKKASFKHKGYTFNFIDLPGTYSITSFTPEEVYVRNHLFNEMPDVVLNVIDASNLERNLYLTTQLIDLDLKVVAALNMYDEMQEKGDLFDFDSLGKMIGIPIIPTVGSKGEGLKSLYNKIIEVYEDKEETVRHIHINYGQDIEKSITLIQDIIRTEENKKLTIKVAPRFLAIKLLERDKEEELRVKEQCTNHFDIFTIVDKEISKLETHFKDTAESVITDYKYGFIEGALKETFKQSVKDIRHLSRFIDNIITNKLLSYPIFILIMWLIFQSTFTLGAYPMHWLEVLVTQFGGFLSGIMNPGTFHDLIVDGIIGGVGGVIVFLPNILILFFFISIMEDTGYMARVAFIIDKVMHKIGLHGRSFIPMIMGFGCNVPAIMATRTIGSKNARLVTMLINPFMSCSARLPIYVLIIGAVFPDHPGLMLFTIYGIGIFLSVIIAIIFKKTIFKSKEMPFVMELPPYRMPTVKAIARHTWFVSSQYLRKMGGIILIASIIIWCLQYFPRYSSQHDNFTQRIEQENEKYKSLLELASEVENKNKITENFNYQIKLIELEEESLQQENSYIGKIGHFIEPAILPLGFDWKIGVSLLAGVAGKEIVVSTLSVINQTDITTDDETKGLTQKLQELKFTHPSVAKQKVFTRLTAFGFLIFILVYFPCIAVIATIRKESGGWRWALFMAIYTTSLAYILALAIHQIGILF